MPTKENAVTEVIEIPASFAEFALAVGLPHDAGKGEVLAAIAATKASSKKLLETIGADSHEAAIGKIEAERSTHADLVSAIVGDAIKNPTTADARAKLDADRKAQERTDAEALITTAKLAGKTVGEKTLALFDAHGMAALKAHLEALTPNAPLVTTAPRQPASTSPTTPSGTGATGEAVVVLTKADEKMIKSYGLNREEFIAARKAQLEFEREAVAE